jgi:hypothetical protein
MNKELWTIEILHKDSHCVYKHENIVSIHEEGSYTVLVREDGVVFKFPTVPNIWRLKCIPQEGKK